MTARKWFAISSFLLLVLVVVVAVNSYNADWKKYQRAYLTRSFTTKFFTNSPDQAKKQRWMQAQQLRAQAEELEETDPDRQKIEALLQQARALEEAAWNEDLSFLERAQIAVDAELNLKVIKVVTEAGRSADLCMTCHIDGAQLLQQHRLVNSAAKVEELERRLADLSPRLEAAKRENRTEEIARLQNELADLEAEQVKIINRQFVFDQVGCTACHGGDRLGLTVRGVHREMRLDFAQIFQESLEKLRSPRWMERQAGIERIRWMTGQDFGFSFSAPEAAREEAIQRAILWWKIRRDTFLAEGFGERTSPFKTENPLAKQIAERADISAEARPQRFIGSQTCLACHAQPGLSEAYIAESNRTHVERWFREAFMTSKNEDIYQDHPFIDKDILKTLDVTCEACHGPGGGYVPLMQKGLAFDAQATAFDREKKQLDAEIQALEEKIKQASPSEASELQRQLENLKQRANELADESAAAATRAGELLKRAKEIARCNARRNMSDLRIWALLERLIERAGPSPLAGTGPEPDLKAVSNVHCE